jgi:hypothetical protein
MPILETTGEELHERIDFDRKEWEESIPDEDKVQAIKRYREYAVGKQREVLTNEQGQFLTTSKLGENLANYFADNICHPIIAQAADRIIFTGYQVEPAEGKDAESVKNEQNFCTEDVYKKCNLSSLSGETLYATFRDGNFALMPIWMPEKRKLKVVREDWWDGDSGIFFAYDDESELLYAVKEWEVVESKDKKFKRRTVYFDDRIERYRSDNNGQKWERYFLDSDGNQWPIPWLKLNGDPLHIPCIHFGNAGRESGNYGLSELVGGIRGFQDHVNRINLAILVAADMTAYQMYYITNGKPAKNADGSYKNLSVGPGKMIISLAPEDEDAPSLNTEIGVLPAGDLSQLINALELKLKRAAHDTRTPLHSITGVWPSGEALFRAEQPAVDKAKRQVEKLKPALERLAHRGMEIVNTFDGKDFNEDAMITAVIDSVEQLGTLKDAMADRELATAAQTWTNAGRPLADFLREHGWSEQRLKQLKQEQEVEEQKAIEEEERAVDRVLRTADKASSNGRERVGT